MRYPVVLAIGYGTRQIPGTENPFNGEPKLFPGMLRKRASRLLFEDGLKPFDDFLPVISIQFKLILVSLLFLIMR